MSCKGQLCYGAARKRIPGGTQVLSKRPEMLLPHYWPSYYARTQGVDVWDLDGNRYVDMSYNGIGACVLGAADPDVDGAVKAAIDQGSMSTLNCPEEVELAELLCDLHPWADMVRYARTGGEAMAVAVRIARAHTQRDRVAFCGYHGWHDWYLAANLAGDHALDGHLLPGLSPRGVPQGLRGTALPFRYNHLEDLDQILAVHHREVAAVIMEPVRDHEPEPGFLDAVRERASACGAVLIVDEISSGFRLNTGGAHLVYGLSPDIAVFAKAMSNGYPMAAVVGRAQVMEAAQRTFISSTYWAERVGTAAALATIRKHRENEVAKHLMAIGQQVQTAWIEVAARTGLPLQVSGIKPLSHFVIAAQDGQAAATLFTQMMLERGFLAAKSFYATFAHTAQHIADYRSAVEEVFAVLAEAIAKGTVRKQLKGPPAETGFARLT